MRRWASLAVVAAALVGASSAFADNPPAVYSDYAQDGVLSCSHSRAALKSVLNDASFQQYGDPLTMLGLKLAVRKQLAGGCRREERATLPIGAAAVGSAEPPSTGGTASEKQQTRGVRKRPQSAPNSTGHTRADAVADAPTERQGGWMVFLAVALLLLTLGSGGWAARRAFSDEP